ncbi:DUF4912 domain-containing protein, partial [Dapis sp. BLCC M172]|uniref:DUF4912 domain-containing protein n=1 Tax=Dapis sp. BLCC M172 TaxID=2975281 RepID=UPI003CF0E44A
ETDVGAIGTGIAGITGTGIAGAGLVETPSETTEETTETPTTETTSEDTNKTDVGAIGTSIAGIAGTGIAGAAGIAALVAAWANQEKNSQITLTPGPSQTASATWSVPQADKDAAKLHGGQQYQLRVYDVTDIDLDSQTAHSVKYYDSEESNQQWQIGNLLSDGEYQAEIGYVTDDGEWLKLARSQRVLILEEYVSKETRTGTEKGLVSGATARWKLMSSPSQVTITPDDAENMMVAWKVSQTAQNHAKEEGGEEYQLRVYDVTDIELDAQPASNVQAYDCDESTQNQMQVPVVMSDREYQAEIGYATDDGEWLKLARSNRLRMPPSNMTQENSTQLNATQTTPVIPKEALKSSWITIVPRSNQSAYAYWGVAQTAQDAAKQQGGQQYQVRILDVTDIDLESQKPHNIQQYNCDESSQKKEITINIGSVGYVDYVAEIGYVTNNFQWLKIASSSPMRMPVFTEVDSVEKTGTILSSTATATIGAGAVSQVSNSKLETTKQTSNITPGDCEIQHLVVHSRNNCYLLNDEQMRGIKETSVSQILEPGIYILRIKSGTFGYGSNICPSGEPVVLLWICGGKVKNKKTKIPVEQTWSTLNGYNETLTLEVLETATLYSFFVDTYPDDNEGELTVSVARLYSGTL